MRASCQKMLPKAERGPKPFLAKSQPCYTRYATQRLREQALLSRVPLTAESQLAESLLRNSRHFATKKVRVGVVPSADSDSWILTCAAHGGGEGEGRCRDQPHRCRTDFLQYETKP